MGLRFRRSIKIAPGLRLNLSPGGVSATVGPRGASVNVGRRGTYLNLGLPGTGLSYRERLDAPPTRAGARGTYRQLVTEQRGLERARERADAAAEHEQSETRLSALREVLRARNREPYDWYQRWGPRGVYQTVSFTPPTPSFSGKELSDTVAKRIPIIRWLLLVVPLAGTAVAFGSLSSKILGVLVLFATAGCVQWLRHVRKTLTSELLRTKSEELSNDAELLRRDHELIEGARHRDWEDEEAERELVRGAESRDDPAPLFAVLEAELANEVLPMPLVIEFEMPSVEVVRLELSLPDIDEIPEERTELTKTGRLSKKKMAQRDRVALYADVCCGASLLLIHETFRVLPMVRSVEVFGTTEGLNPATGKPHDFVALHLQTDRQSFEQINLDAVDPSAALSGLGGKIAVGRKGELSPLSGVVGLLGE